MRASALFLSSGELSQASTANSKSCAYERLARRDGRLMSLEAPRRARRASSEKFWGSNTRSAKCAFAAKVAGDHAE
eukprot:scaffold54942_cov75-Phaeocystis_antarctica.AAC.9